MGCNPSIRKANDIPPSNVKPSNKNITSIGNFIEGTPSTSNIKQNNYDQIIKNDIYIQEERNTPLMLQRMDFINKKYIPQS